MPLVLGAEDLLTDLREVATISEPFRNETKVSMKQTM